MKTKTINGITYTHRTRDGKPARILCTDKVSKEYTVVALVLGTTEIINSYTRNLRYFADGPESDHDLFEGVEPEIDWSEVKIDTPVWCRFYEGWHKRHFAGLDKHGIPTAWVDGYTSHTTDRKDTWREMRLTNPET
jgi:hypothetical protein